MEKRVIKYIANPTAVKFHASDAFVRAVRGPVRSGKSVMMAAEIFRRLNEQKKGPDGKRHSKWAVVRNTYKQLEKTTIATWLQWWPTDIFGQFNETKYIHKIRYKDIVADIHFMALDRPNDIGDLLSLELTSAWVNEARDIPKGLIDMLLTRLGQYPSDKDGGYTWRGLIMDTNPMSSNHWWYKMAEKTSPEERPGWEFFAQPPAMIERDGKFYINPEAENINNLNEGAEYYITREPGMERDYVRVFFCNQYGFVKEGRPVHPDYVDHVHCSKEIIKPIKRYPIYVGMDFGLTPAAIFGQHYEHNGRKVAIDELVTEDMGADKFAQCLNEKIQRDYKDFKFEFWGDPAGDDRVQTDEQTIYQILAKNGIDATPAIVNAKARNDPTIRRESLAIPLRRLVNGKPEFMVSPKCEMLREGLAGGFCYKRIQISGPEAKYHEKPDKNRYSHPVEACEYMMIGMGMGEKVIIHLDSGFEYPEKADMEYDELSI